MCPSLAWHVKNKDNRSAFPSCLLSRRKLITEAARELERSKMARFDEKSGNLYVTG